MLARALQLLCCATLPRVVQNHSLCAMEFARLRNGAMEHGGMDASSDGYYTQIVVTQ